MALKTLAVDDFGSLHDLVDGYLAACDAEGKSSRTLEWYGQKLQVFLRWLGDRYALGDAPVRLDPHDLRLFIAFLKETPAIGRGRERTEFTVRGYVQVIKGFATWLVEEGYLAEHPFTRVALPRTPEYVVRPLSQEEAQRLVGAIRTQRPADLRDRTIILLMLDTGLRISEVAGLSLDEARRAITEGIVCVFGKGRKERFVPVGETVRGELRRYLIKARGASGTALFLGEGLLPYQTRGIRAMIGRRAKAASLTGVHPHRLRHTFAVMFLRKGGDIRVLQKILGHTTLTMTAKYLNLVFEDVQAAHRDASPADGLFGRRRAS